jgi:hypothetical protein
MQATLKDIPSDKFAKVWIAEYRAAAKGATRCSSGVENVPSKRSARSCAD